MASFWNNLLGAGQRMVAGLSSATVMGVETPSSDHNAMAPVWQKISDVMAGGDTIRAAGERYLPRYAEESDENYRRRLRDAPWRPEFADALQSLCARPFTKPITLSGNPSAEIIAVADDVDMQGNNLGVFAKQFFTSGVAKGLAAVLVDHTRDSTIINGRPRTRADEKAMGVRPYWSTISPENLLAVYLTTVKGKIVVHYAKIRECGTEQDEFGERSYERIRILELDQGGRAFWTLYEKQAGGGGYVQIDTGDFTVGFIPLVLFFTGERFGNYGVRPPLYDLCGVQLELYRAMARENEILNFAGWPNLVFIGMKKPEGDAKVSIGPSQVFFAPPSDTGNSDVKYIGPDASVIEQVAKSPERIMTEFRRLAMQPTLPKSGDMTATASAIDGSRAHAAVEQWAAGLKDSLDQALKFTAMWLKQPDNVTAVVQTDFIAHSRSVEEARVLGDAQKRAVISKKTERGELKRRGILSSDFEEEKEDEQIALETGDLEAEDEDFDPRAPRLVAGTEVM